MNGSASFGYWVRRRRKALDLTQLQLAQRSGYALTTIRKIENDARRPSREMAERLADSLELAPAERAAFVQAARAELAADRLPGLIELARDRALEVHGSIAAPPHPASAPAAARNHPPSNLTVQPTALLGRAHEVAAVCATLRRPDVRLLTLTGAPGIGKSRIGLQAAADLLASFEDGVFAVGLAAVDTPVGLAEALAQALALRDQDSQAPIERLKLALSGRRLLIVLDNFERSMAAAPLVAELLAAAPGLKVLITSRAALRLSGEHELPVPPLPLPALDPLPPLAALASNPAVELFVARSRSVQPDFALSQQNAPAVAAICARLDGLPLAIELAAARGKLFAPQAMLARLQSRLALLTDGARDLPPHQRTLRAAIGWSHELLSPAERELFARLAVFAAGCTIESAEAICDDRRWRMDDRRVALEADAIAYRPSSVVDGIAALVDKSLLRQESGPAGEPRFVMLETIREFALEQLDALAEADALRRRHALFFLDLAEAAEQQARGPDQLPAIERLSAEHENLRAALRWAIARGEAAVAIRLSGALGWFWDTRSYLSEGRRWLAAALAAGDAPPDYRARALTSAGLLAGDQNDFAAARELFDQGLALYHAAADQRGAAYALSYLGRMLRCQGEYPAAQERLDEALALFQAIGDRRGAAYASYNLGRVTYQQGDFEAAQRMFATGLALFAAAGDTWGQALAHANLGRVAYRRGDYAAARAAQERGLALFEQVGDTWGQALAHCKLGWAAYRQGDRAARAHFTESLARASRAQYAEGIADALAGLGALALENRQWQRAARLLAASDGLRAAVGDVLHTTDDLADDRWLVSLRRQLGRPAFEAAWRAGQSAPVEQILAEALS